MNTRVWLLASILCGKSLHPDATAAPAGQPQSHQEGISMPLGKAGASARYAVNEPLPLAKTTVAQFTLSYGPIETNEGRAQQWLQLGATKASGDHFQVWLLSSEYPPANLREAQTAIGRYILQEGSNRPLEFRNRFTHQAVLPALGAWTYLIPRSAPDSFAAVRQPFAPETVYLGHRYSLTNGATSLSFAPPNDARLIELLPQVLTGVASNTRQKDERRRYDNSDYELVRLTPADYREMLDAGMNCFKVDAGQLSSVEELDAFYWGLSPAELPYPECLYRSTYLGPTLFVDEPAVGTRDYVIRPRLAKEESFRTNLTPQIVLEAFQQHFHQAVQAGAPQVLFNDLKSRADVDLGVMRFTQANLFSWETMVSTAGYELSQDPEVPAAMVFEPPGRVGTLRTLPELDMTYGCQIPVDDPKNFIDIIYGFLRGAARLTDKGWGTSIYGAVDRADAFWFLTHAYDLGATRFFFWDNARSACVPYHECLALARDLQAHAQNYPGRDLNRLKQAAEVAILLPAGYNLGHVQLGKGSLWGLGELNLERLNRQGVKYRTVMSNFFVEIERCVRLGIAFDLLWDLPGQRISGYREVTHVLEDGHVRIEGPAGERLLEHAREPVRPAGDPPGLSVTLSPMQGKAPLHLRLQAQVTETSAPVYYTLGADRHGICQNAYAAFELFGPGEADYRFLTEVLHPHVTRQGKQTELESGFTLPRPGTYRLRTATVDLAGRSTVVWRSIKVSESD